MKPPLPNSYWVQPGRWLAGEYPGGRGRADTRKRLQVLLDAGIDSFIDLTEPHERDAYAPELPQDVRYQRFPLPDHGVPASTQAMQEVVDAIEAALAAGRNLYVHCRAGIGRTGMAVGCHLASRGGLGGEKALVKLNELWQANARAATWPAVPETPAQREFLRTWGRKSTSISGTYGRPDTSGVQPVLPVSDDDTGAGALEATRRVRERFLGALTGLAVGDALAAATQYRRPGTFAPVGDMLGGGPFGLPRGAWTDDTAMALCLAESLAERNGTDARDQVERYQRWKREGYLSATGECVGITPAVSRALALAGWRRQAHAGSHDPSQLDKEPLVRAAPVAMWFFGDAAAAANGMEDAVRTTHQAPVVIDACRLFASYVHAALAGRSKTRILAGDPELWRRRPLKPEVEYLAQQLAGTKPMPAEGRGGGGGILEALRVSMQAFAGARDFRSGALQVANFGGDSDVATAAYGQLAGAHYGIGAIPQPWREALAARDVIEALSDRLLAHALSSLAEP